MSIALAADFSSTITAPTPRPGRDDHCAGNDAAHHVRIHTAFTQETQEAAKAEWRAVADRLRERFPKLGALMDEAKDDVLAHLAFPKEHWPPLHSTNPLERLNGEINWRTDVVAIFPNEADRQAGRRAAARAERRVGGDPSPLHEPGKARSVQR